MKRKSSDGDQNDNLCNSSTQIKKQTHTGEKPYTCDQCDYRCSSNGDLKKHERTHTGEKPYTCDKCKYCCSHSGHLKTHKRTHTGEKPYKCDQCDYCCSESGTLITHKRTHTGEKPYKCDQCDYCCITTGSLTVHKRTHTGEKPYKCDHCYKYFTTSSSRSKHHKMHEEQKLFEFLCIMQECGTQEASVHDLKCTIRCKTELDLDYHIQRHHTDEGIAQKFKSEQQLAAFFDHQKISYDRDWLNRIAFTNYKNIEGNLGNDKFAHRQTNCEFQRIFNIANALETNSRVKQRPIVYVRFNPHFFRKDGKFYDMPIAESHKLLLDTINGIAHVPKQGVNLIYVNYDTQNGKLCIFENDEEDNNSKLFIDSVVQKTKKKTVCVSFILRLKKKLIKKKGYFIFVSRLSLLNVRIKKKKMTTTFQQIKAYAQALYNRIPKPEQVNNLSRQETGTYLGRLERLHVSCGDKLQISIHYPNVSEQQPNNVVQNYVYDGNAKTVGTTDKKGEFTPLTSGLTEAQKTTVQQQRCDAIIVYSSNSCRATQKIDPNHLEILFILAFSSDIAIQFLDNFLQTQTQPNQPVFAEVPASWDGFFASAGFTQYPPKDFGTTVPPQSFLHTWMLDKLSDYKVVQDVLLTVAGSDLKFPADSALKMPPEVVLPNVLFANSNPYSKNTKVELTRFMNDKDALIAFGNKSQGKVSTQDAEHVRKMLVNMFNFAQNVNTPQTWAAMLEVERMYGEYGIVANPSAQTWFTDIMQRNDKNEILSKLRMLRGFVSQFPRFAPQQIRAEHAIQKMLKGDNLKQSLAFIRSNITEPGDFEFVALNATDDIKQVYIRMMYLRQWWTTRFGALIASAKALESAQTDKSPNAQTDAPIIAMRQKAADIIKNAVDVERQFRITLQNVLTSTTNQATKLSVRDWLEESQNSEQSLQSLGMSSSSSSSSLDVSLPVSQVADQFAQKLLNDNKKLVNNNNDSTNTTVIGDLEIKRAEPASEIEFNALISQVKTNLAMLQSVETTRKAQVRAKIKEVAAAALGTSNAIKEIAKTNNNDNPNQYQQERKELIQYARGCQTNLVATISNPRIDMLADKAKEAEVTETELIDVHNSLVDITTCLNSNYNALQALDKHIAAESEIENAAQNEAAVKQIMDDVRKADTAIEEAQTVVKRLQSVIYVQDTDKMKNIISEMIAKRNDMQTLQEAFIVPREQLPKPAIVVGKTLREEKLKRSKQLLTEIVKTNLEIGQQYVQATEQMQLLYAMQNSSKNMNEAKALAQQSAELAQKHLEAYRVQQLASQELKDRAVVLSSSAREVTASFDTLDETRKKIVLSRRVELMRLVTQLEMYVNQRYDNSFIISGLKELQTYFDRNRESLTYPEMDVDKRRLAAVVEAANRKLHEKRTTILPDF